MASYMRAARQQQRRSGCRLSAIEAYQKSFGKLPVSLRFW
jgi:hypothetical protein